MGGGPRHRGSAVMQSGDLLQKGLFIFSALIVTCDFSATRYCFLAPLARVPDPRDYFHPSP